MEMPEGWKRIKQDSSERSDKEDMLDFLKEMTDIMLKTYNISGELGFYLKDKGSPQNSKEIVDLVEITNEIRQFMKKFKDWK